MERWTWKHADWVCNLCSCKILSQTAPHCTAGLLSPYMYALRFCLCLCVPGGKSKVHASTYAPLDSKISTKGSKLDSGSESFGALNLFLEEAFVVLKPNILLGILRGDESYHCHWELLEGTFTSPPCLWRLEVLACSPASVKSWWEELIGRPAQGVYSDLFSALLHRMHLVCVFVFILHNYSWPALFLCPKWSQF